MSDILKTVDPWFLFLSILILGGFVVWSAQYILVGIKDSIHSLEHSVNKSAEKMERLINDLFNYRNNHETRIVALETRCDIQHGDEYTHVRTVPGRRPYDPPQFPQEQP